MAERTCLQQLGGGHELPVGALCRMVGKKLHLLAAVVSADGRELIQAEAERPAGQPHELGLEVAQALLDQGAAALLAAVPGRGA
jgi:hydroxymethylbilane synthase